MLTELKTSGSTPTDLKEIEVGIDTPDKGVVKMTLAEFIYYSSLDSDETESDTDSDLDHAHKPDELGLHATRGHVDDTIFTSRRLPSPGEDDVQSGDSSVTDEERSIPSGHLLAVEEYKDGSISEPASRTLDSSRTPHPDQLANNDSQIVFGDLNMDEDTALPGFSERPDDSLSWVSDDGSDSENSILTTRASRVGDTLDDEMGDTLGTVSGFTR